MNADTMTNLDTNALNEKLDRISEAIQELRVVANIPDMLAGRSPTFLATQGSIEELSVHVQKIASKLDKVESDVQSLGQYMFALAGSLTNLANKTTELVSAVMAKAE